MTPFHVQQSKLRDDRSLGNGYKVSLMVSGLDHRSDNKGAWFLRMVTGVTCEAEFGQVFQWVPGEPGSALDCLNPMTGRNDVAQHHLEVPAVAYIKRFINKLIIIDIIN